MKSTFKVGIILGVVVFFVLAYSMEEYTDTAKYYLILSKKIERNRDLFSEMTSLDISGQVSPGRFLFFPLCKNNPIFTDKELALSLSAIQVIKESKIKRKSIILENIGDAIHQGVSLASRYSLEQMKSNLPNQSMICIRANHPDDNYISIFDVIEYWIKQEHSNITESVWYEEDLKVLYNKREGLGYCRSSILETILAAGNRRKNDMNHVLKKIEAPQDIINLIFSYLCDEENVSLLKQVGQKLDSVSTDIQREPSRKRKRDIC